MSQFVMECKDIHKQILIEDMPSGARFLSPIAKAMKIGRALTVTYQSYFTQEASEFEPYCLKSFKRRWYVLARSSKHDDLRVFALDCFKEMALTNRSYALPRNFDGEKYFSGYHGVVMNEKPELVRLWASSLRAQYLRSLPLHKSQKEVKCVPETAPKANDGYSIFEMKVAPTFYCVSPNKDFNIDFANIFNTDDALRKDLKGFINFINENKKTQGIASIDQKGEFFRKLYKDDSLVDAAVFLLTNYRHIYWHALNDFFIKLQDELHSIFGDDLLPREIDINMGKEKTIDRYVSEIIFEEKDASKLAPMYYRIRLKNEKEWTLQSNRAKGFFLGLDKKQQTKDPNAVGWEKEIYLSDFELPLLNLWDFTQGDTINLLNKKNREAIGQQYAQFVKDELNNLN